MIDNSTKKPRVGVFIDGSNLLWAMKSLDDKGVRKNYNICFKKLKNFLQNTYAPTFFNYYVCVDTSPTIEPYVTRAVKSQKFNTLLEKFGYTLKKKDLKKLKNGETKCDTDVEIVIDLYKYINNIDTIILFTGDSDFKSAIEEFHGAGKEIILYSFKSSLSWELKKFTATHTGCNHQLLDVLKTQIERTPSIDR